VHRGGEDDAAQRAGNGVADPVAAKVHASVHAREREGDNIPSAAEARRALRAGAAEGEVGDVFVVMNTCICS
jgi:hypothetical protein